VLDGARLMVKTGTYGAANSKYGTEIENFATVTAIGTQGSGPLSFEVLTKDGVKMEFGNTADSRFMSQAGNTVMFWRLNKITNPDGNYIEYVYTDTSTERDSRISEIRYTGNASFLPYNKIEFAYKIRQETAPGTFSDIRTTYEAGSSIVSKYLLDLITVKVEGATVKKYQFGYGHDNVNSYLKSVTEFGSDNSQLNPTIFKYGDKPVLRTSGSTNISAGNGIQTFSGDYNGDGRDDVVSAHVSSTSDGIDYMNSFTVFKTNVAGTSYTQIASVNLPVNFTVIKTGGQKYSVPNSRSILANDFTGDGIDDILTLNIVPNGTTESKLANVTIYESKNNGTSFDPHARSVQPNYDRIHSSKKFFYPGDFDGDGISEYITILGNTSGSYLPFLCSNYLTGGTGSCGAISIPGATNFPVGSWVNAHKIEILDFDGDGKQDIMFIGSSLTEVFTLQGYNATRIYSGNSFTTASGDLFFGDFNGDGKSDILEVSEGLSAFKKWSSTGKAFLASSINISNTTSKWPSPNSPEYDENVVVIGDYNGDGKSDIFVRWARATTTSLSGGSTQVERRTGEDIYYSTADAFTYQEVTYNVFTYILGPTILEPTESSNGITTIYDVPTDLNGDGRTDLVSIVQGVMSYLMFNKDGKDNLLHRVSNGLDHITEWNYKSLVGDDSFYKRGTGTSSYPLNTVQPTALLVYNFKVPNGIEGASTIEYSYEEGWFHRAGKGFIDFKFVYTKDNTTNTRTVSENQLNTTYYTSVPYKTTTYLGISTIVLNTTTLTNAFVSPAAKRFWVKTTGLLENDAVTGRTINTTNTYDDNSGNITYSKMDVNSGVEKTETITVYGAYPAGILNKPTSVTISRTRGTQTPAYTTVTEFGYNSIGQQTSKTEFPNTAKSVATTYGYNNKGNLTSTTVTPSGMTARTRTSTFDAKGRYSEFSENEMSHGSSATYDAKWGKPLTATGINGQTTTYTYDGFGRPATTIFPGPYILTQTYIWDQNSDYRSVWKSKDAYTLAVPDATQGKPDVTVWYDLLGRQVRTETEGFSGTIIQKQTYDAKGNIKTSTQPHLFAETAIVTTNSYHTDYNWLTNVDKGTALGATNLTYAYSSGTLTLTTSAPTGTTTETTDASGKVIQATDDGGTLSYTYYNHGGLKEVKKDNIVITSSEYDAYGRQTKLTDLNAGVTTYEFDALGQLVSQTNAKGVTHNMQYNILGQLTSRGGSGSEGTTSYIYGTSNSGGESKGMVKQVTSFAADNQTSYAYDAIGQISSVIEKIANVDHTTTYTYNKFGALVTTTYPSGLAITNIYDLNGYLKHIRNGSTDIYTNGSVNGQGQVLTYSMGNGKSSTNTFENGFPTKFETTDGIQNLSMGWNFQKRNLISRTDARSIVNKTESFTYDNLNRLTESKIGSSSFITNYAPSGNIEKKTDAGEYKYKHATKINAVTDVTNPTPSPIPSFQQDISYTAFMQPYQIKEIGVSGPLELTYTYGDDYERIQSVLKQGTTTLYTRYYFGAGFEKEVKGGVTRYIQYIESPAGLAAIVVSSGGSHTFHYTYTDHLGSIVTATSSAGVIEAQQSFDAWGRRRVHTSWALLAPTYTVPGIQDWLYRGYTGHEHLDQFGLINMNGRLYDPVLGRLLSPDNYVQNQFGTQDYNRYSYAKNNPLLYTDPDGNNPIIGAIIGAVSYTLGVAFSDGGFKNWSWFGFGSSVIMGAMTSGFASEIGGAVSAGVTAGTLSPFAAGAIQFGAYGAFGGMTSMVTGGSFVSGALTGAAGSAVGSLTGLIPGIQTNGWGRAVQIGSSAAFGGVVADLSGGNFWSGAAQAGLVAGFNHVAHQALQKFSDAQLKKMFNRLSERADQYKSATEFYESIGGPLGDWAKQSPEQFTNTCAARLSDALNYSGFDIPAGTPGTYTGGDGKFYFIQAKQMVAYLSKGNVWGEAKAIQNISRVKNAVIFQTGFSGGITGHLDIIYRGIPAHNAYDTKTVYWH
jgi:RHS repeat-associated protein